uniref:Uncharacterized protein n=1 Tax=Globisporangium ultimum (strain ATCC 200006 / CBS 805.95 / DAOM BR144) TaxID=431595 RepID=K3WHR5_GLOUD
MPLATLKQEAALTKKKSGEIKLSHINDTRPVPQHDEHVVLQLLEEIHQLVMPSQVLATDSPRLHAAAKLYLDTRDTFEMIEHKVEEHLQERPKILRKLSKRASANKEIEKAGIRKSAPTTPEVRPRSVDSARSTGTVELYDEGLVDRIQDMFRHLGEQLGPAILKELRMRTLTMQSILHYVRFLPADYQWTAYKDARKEKVALAYRAPTPTQTSSETFMLKQHAEFIKEHIRKDVDTVCLFSSDGTLSTIFGDDIKADKEMVAEKFESLVTDVYSSYLRSIIDTQMDQLTRLSEHWQLEMTASKSLDPPFVQHFSRMRKFRTKINIFPSMMFSLEDRLAGLPRPTAGQTLKILVADIRHLGIWWQKSVLSMTERDISTVHTDENRGIFGRVESLDGQIYLPLVSDNNQDPLRRFWKSGALTKWIGQRLLVNNGKDSIWIEVEVKDVDDKKCKLEMKKSLQACNEVGYWSQYFTTNEWITIRDLKFMTVPLNPGFRIHMGQKFRDVLDVIQSVVVEISSIFPNDELNRKVATALWKSVEPSVSKGEHIYARYLRSILNQDVLPKRTEFIPGRFDDRGCYHHQPTFQLSQATSRSSTLSPFEKLCHHLLEETEIVGVCFQANNASLSRAFVQVLHDKLDKVLRAQRSKFEKEETSKIEFVLAEYANACRFMYVWRISRHELDTIPRQARGKRDASSIHMEWVDRTFERMDKMIIEMTHLQLHFVHRAFFHECSSYLLPGIYEQAWTASKPWFGNSRCTYGIQFFVIRLQSLLEYISNSLLPLYERPLAVHDKLHDLVVWMILDSLPCITASYETITVSRARTTQWKIDVLYLVCGVHKLLRLLDRIQMPRTVMSDERGKLKPSNEVRGLCLRLL